MSELGATSPRNYLSEIDGLRAIAILAVMLFHARVGADGGFVGVDIFFVVSGYLITRQLSLTPTFSFVRIVAFWFRRIRRIAPALSMVSLCVFVLSLFLLMPNEQKEFGESLQASSFFFANYFFASRAGYFDTPSLSKPLLHTWSLGVEIQFYLLMPLLMAFFPQNAIKRRWLVVLVLLSSLAFGILEVHENKSSLAFYGLPSRIWEFLFGSVMALGVIRITNRTICNQTLQFFGLLLIVYPIFFYSKTTPFPGGYALVPCLGVALLIGCFEASTYGPATYLLRHPLLVWLGKHSYSLYLWHWPLLVLAAYVLGRRAGSLESVLVLLLSLVLAMATVKYVEEPFLKWKYKSTVGKVRLSIALITTFFASALLAWLSIEEQGFPSRLSPTAQKYAAGAKDVAPDAELCHTLKPERVERQELCPLGGGRPPIAAPTIVLWGDSHAHALYGLFDRLARENNIFGAHASRSACPPLLMMEVATHSNNECKRFNSAMVNYINEQNPDTVVLVAYWAIYSMGFMPYSLDMGMPPLLVENLGEVTSEKKSKLLFEKGLRATIEKITKPGRKIWLVEQFPEATSSIPEGLARATLFPFASEEFRLNPRLVDVEHRQAFVNNLFVKLSNEYGVNILPAHNYLCGGGLCQIESDGVPLYRDSNHLSNSGASFVAPVMLPIFNKVNSAH